MLSDNTLPQLQAEEMTSLTNAAAVANGGATFTVVERTYSSQQMTARRRTVALVDASIARATSVELQTMLTQQIRPLVAAHLQTALQLRRG